jgi:CzcA family heavy metal efflux pump
MRWMVANSLRFKYLAVFVPIVLMTFGSLQLRQAPVDVFPEFAPPRVEIQTAALGLSATEVEELVTVPLEEALNGVDGLDTIRSKSVPDLSSILMIFEPGTDQIRARQLVQERVAVVTPALPRWASPPIMLPPLSATSRAMKIGLTSDEHSLIDMSMTSYWRIRQRLMRVPGVANVAIWGERLEMLQVQVDPERLDQNQVSLNHLMQATADAVDSGILQYSDGAYIGTGGFIETPNQRLGLRHNLPILTPEDLAKVPVAERDGEVLTLADLAEVKVDHQPLIGDAVINDGPGLMLIVEKFPWGNTLEVTAGVEEALDELKPGLQGIEIDSEIFRPATFIELSLRNLTNAMVIGSILVVLVLGLFLFEWRAAVISVIAIPMSLVAAAVVLYVRGTTINVMVLAGLIIALGAVVDDAIIDVENIVRRLRQNRIDGVAVSTGRVIFDASLEVRSAVVYATLIEVAALIPVFFLQGLSGAFFRPLAGSYALAVMASMAVALTVTPALSLILLRSAPLEHRESPLVPLLRRTYTRMVSRTIRSPRPAYGAVAVLVMAGVVVYPTMGQELLPDFKERDFLMHWLTRPGTSQPEMQRITAAVSPELRAVPGVRNFGAHIGQALNADEVVGVDFGENWISVDPSADYDQTVAAIQETVDGYPGLYRDVQTYLKERIREVLTGSSDAIVIRVFGPDLDVLDEKAREIEAQLASVEGLQDLHVELHVKVPQLSIDVDLEAARRHGILPGQVRRAVATIVGGEEAGDVFRYGQAYDIQVWSIPQARQSVDAVNQLLIDTPSGEPVPLSELAEVSLRPVDNTVERENQSRRLDVSANISGRDLGAVARDVQETVAGVDLPLGYSVEVIGEFQERQESQRALLQYSLLAAAIVLLLLYISFGSWRLALLAFVCLPSALVGGILAAYFTGGVLSLGSLVGFLTVLGIAARNGIMMISHFQHLEREEGMTFGPELVLRGGLERLAPILMTSLATGLALVPLVVAGDIAGHEIEHPMAIVILGGLVTSTFLNLFVVPSLYLKFGRPATEGLGPSPSAHIQGRTG